MMISIQYESILDKIQKHFKEYEITSSVSKQEFDLDSNYLDTSSFGRKGGFGNIDWWKRISFSELIRMGSLKHFEKSLDIERSQGVN